MSALCTDRGSCDDYPHFLREENRLEYPLLLVRRRKEDGTRGHAGMASEKPIELSGVSNEDWNEFRRKVNDTIFTCPFSYARVSCFILIWLMFVSTTVIATFGAIGDSLYFWDGFWKCQSSKGGQSKTSLYHEPYTYRFCMQNNGWGNASILSFFILFCSGLFTGAYIEARIIKRWRREIEPILVAICEEYAPLFQKHGFSPEMQRWSIIFQRTLEPDISETYEPPDGGIHSQSNLNVGLSLEQV